MDTNNPTYIYEYNSVDEMNATEYFTSDLICELGQTKHRMFDKYSEIVGAIAENLICICIYPDNPTVNHWRGRAAGLCKQFAQINIEPIKNNTYNYRYKALYAAVVEIFDADFAALKYRFTGVDAYYSKRPDVHERLTTCKPIKKCYELYKDKVISGIKTLTDLIAKQDYPAILDYMNEF